MKDEKQVSKVLCGQNVTKSIQNDKNISNKNENWQFGHGMGENADFEGDSGELCAKKVTIMVTF
ncbi:MAG: hypothetical protein J6J78_01050 [Clostridia bacterium]|nr:hypothetical protein [Clostridia bacterium]MBP3651642.1 hypothetical protein [Clostridia bacterium]